MSSLLTFSDDADSVIQEQSAIPPLFAGPLRDDMSVRISAAISAGDHEKAAVLLHEADDVFPGDAVFSSLRARCVRLAQRKAQFEAALQAALNELSDDRFAASLGKFREAVSLSRGYDLFSGKIYGAGVAAAEKHVQRHWRFAEALVQEVSGLVEDPNAVSAIERAIETQKRGEDIRRVLDESARAEQAAHLPHLRERLEELAATSPEPEQLSSCLRTVESLITQRFAEERDKNLRRITLFRDRLDLTAKPETLRGFAELVSPFAAPYPSDPAFLAILEEVRDLRSKYDCAVELLEENRLQESLLISDQVLKGRPANVLFCAIEEKAKAHEWVLRRVSSAVQRARAFEEKAEYAEALEEWESLREIDPRHPGLESEILHCAALKQQAEGSRCVQPTPPVDETALIPEIVELFPEQTPELEPDVEVVPYEPRASILFATPPSAGIRIAITQEAWDHFKTGLAAAFAVLLVVLIFATSGRH
jgi:tetratricopeptide (TPR) repeat protein